MGLETAYKSWAGALVMNDAVTSATTGAGLLGSADATITLRRHHLCQSRHGKRWATRQKGLTLKPHSKQLR